VPSASERCVKFSTRQISWNRVIVHVS
jgi:hypothetical protein